MARKQISDEEMEREIQDLNQSQYVKLARYEQRIRYRKRQYLYTLRYLEKRGKELAESGVTFETLAAMESEIPEEGESENGRD